MISIATEISTILGVFQVMLLSFCSVGRPRAGRIPRHLPLAVNRSGALGQSARPRPLVSGAPPAPQPRLGLGLGLGLGRCYARFTPVASVYSSARAS